MNERLPGESPCAFVSGDGWYVCRIHGWTGPASQRSRVTVCPDFNRGPSLQDLANALAVVFAYNASNATVAPDGSLAFGEGPTSYWRDRAEAVAEAMDAAVKGAA